MKKLIIIICIFFILGLTVVNAEYQFTKGRHVVNLYVEKGWNLIPITMSQYLLDGYNPNEIDLPEDTITRDDLLALFIYDVENKKYVSGGSNFYSSSPEMTEFNNRIRSNTNLFNYYGHSGAWIYSKKSGRIILDLNVQEMPKTIGAQIFEGWNFLMITPDMVGHTFSEIKGDCNILKYAIWTPQLQKWETATGEEVEASPNTIAESSIGIVFLIKVEKDCTLGLGNILPPTIPE